MPTQRRLEALQRRLREREIDAAILYPGPNAYYVSGFFGEPLDRHALLVVPTEADPWFLTPEKSLDQIRDESWIETCVTIAENDPTALARELESNLDPEWTIALDARLPFAVVEPLYAARDDRLITSVEPVLSSLRVRKDDDEVRALQRSAAVADEVSEEIRSLGDDAVGLVESDLAAEIRGRLHRKGGTRLSFPPVVAAGPNAAQPYYRYGDRRIREGEPVILDFGAFVDGYASDQTRTVVFAGEPPSGFEDAYDAVRDALEAGVEAVEPGRTPAEVDGVVESTLADRGFGDRIEHATGHGVGVEAHEQPTVAEGDDRSLEPGMVFSIEPGLYVEGEFGVRVEDLVVVREDGCERLNHSPRTWHPL